MRWATFRRAADADDRVGLLVGELLHALPPGAALLNLLGDPEPWKLEWTKTSRPHNWLFVFSDTNRARLLYPVKFRIIPSVKRSGVAGLVGW